MARTINKLKQLQVSKVNTPGMYGDGAGLWLQISISGSKSWIHRFTLNGKAREMGLGSTSTLSLAEARDESAKCRKLLLSGVDPIEDRKKRMLELKLQEAHSITFKDCQEAYIKVHKPGWRNKKHANQWESTLNTYALPFFGDIPVFDINTSLIMQCLEPIWHEKTETASRVRGRIESILDWATARKYRQGENPARWKGHLKQLLPSPNKIKAVKHHKALPYKDINKFMTNLRNQKGIACKALEFGILTAARTGETIYATWDEVDLSEKTWTIPAERMKARKEHRVPLSSKALEVLEEMKAVRQSDYIFPGLRENKPLSNMSLSGVLKRMERKDVTSHGFRSTFRDWAAEMTSYPNEMAEMALAHTIGDKVEAAYRRGDLLIKRRKMMESWADYCDRKAMENNENVVVMTRQQAN